jgi:phosphomannomutase
MELSVSVKFGTSGLRGLSDDLVGLTTFVYVTAFAQYLLGNKHAHLGSKVFVGRDFRNSSPAIAVTAMQALHAARLVPVDCQSIPTPALADFAMDNGSACLMVTGSHIPADRNGIKFYRPDGEIDKVDELDIVSRAKLITNLVLPNDTENSTFEDAQSIAEELFVRRNMSILPLKALSGLRVGVYQHSTVARDLLVKVLEGYGADVTPLGRSEKFIPVDTEAVSEQTLALLTAWAATGKYDVFVSADGDGDRPLVADETGKPLRGDIIGLLTAELLNAQTIVTPVTSNSKIESEFTGSVVRTRVGSPYVIAGMNQALVQNEGSVVGFEANGGVLTGSAFRLAGGELRALPTRDSFLPILATLNLCKAGEKPLSQVLTDRPFAFTSGNRLENFSQQRAAALMSYLTSPDNLSDYLKHIGIVTETSNVDGLRIKLGNGNIIHYRPSGNAPELRCYVEADSDFASGELLRRSLAAALEFSESTISRPSNVPVYRRKLG